MCLINNLASQPFRTTQVAITLYNTKFSFKDLLGIEREAVSIMSIEELNSNIEQLNYPGIYAIYCKVDGKFYIGGATVLKDRLYSHLCGFLSMPNNRVKPSSNTHLQKALEIYGPANFQVIILHKFLYESPSTSLGRHVLACARGRVRFFL
uniref:GIY-YIG homing endonuclease n=1 Tax=Dunaliella salina TaxID=3046 RepID=D0FXT8_DUNSA|nr:GIY-YIG homing endonuclease [Dunaliella salina]ACS95030.1 GIY-YIG homing endonuclease [Dunaliella salina]